MTPFLDGFLWYLGVTAAVIFLVSILGFVLVALSHREP